jgi:protein-S-isoprenylcysteine O-methyltransferase
MNLEIVVGLVVLLFPLSEVILAVVKRARPSEATVHDRGSMRRLWLVIAGAVALAMLLRGVSAARLRLPAGVRESAALGLLVGGLALRWSAILTLGRLFTTDIAIHQGHRVVDSGPYRYVRHPSYTGLLLAFLGLGVVYGNWLSIAALVVPISFAVAQRIRLEEAALLSQLGAPYGAYCERTKRLIPGIV